MSCFGFDGVKGERASLYNEIVNLNLSPLKTLSAGKLKKKPRLPLCVGGTWDEHLRIPKCVCVCEFYKKLRGEEDLSGWFASVPIGWLINAGAERLFFFMQGKRAEKAGVLIR